MLGVFNDWLHNNLPARPERTAAGPRVFAPGSSQGGSTGRPPASLFRCRRRVLRRVRRPGGLRLRQRQPADAQERVRQPNHRPVAVHEHLPKDKHLVRRTIMTAKHRLAHRPSFDHLDGRVLLSAAPLMPAQIRQTYMENYYFNVNGWSYTATGAGQTIAIVIGGLESQCLQRLDNVRPHLRHGGASQFRKSLLPRSPIQRVFRGDHGDVAGHRMGARRCPGPTSCWFRPLR